MSYSHSGSVATLWSPSNYSGTTKMPVPSTRRYSSNATTASYRTTPSTDRYASSTASYTASRSTQSEYRSRYTAPIRSSTSVPSSYSRLADIHETSSRITSKDRSETNDSNVIGYSRSNKTTDNDVSYSWSKVDGYKLRNDAIPSRFLNSSVTLDSKLLNQRKLGGTSLDFSSKYNGSSAVGKGKTTVGSRLRRKDSLTKSENADSTSPSPVRSVERKSSSAVGGSSSPIEIRKNSEVWDKKCSVSYGENPNEKDFYDNKNSAKLASRENGEDSSDEKVESNDLTFEEIRKKFDHENSSLKGGFENDQNSSHVKDSKASINNGVILGVHNFGQMQYLDRNSKCKKLVDNSVEDTEPETNETDTNGCFSPPQTLHGVILKPISTNLKTNNGPALRKSPELNSDLTTNIRKRTSPDLKRNFLNSSPEKNQASLKLPAISTTTTDEIKRESNETKNETELRSKQKVEKSVTKCGMDVEPEITSTSAKTRLEAENKKIAEQAEAKEPSPRKSSSCRSSPSKEAKSETSPVLKAKRNASPKDEKDSCNAREKELNKMSMAEEPKAVKKEDEFKPDAGNDLTKDTPIWDKTEYATNLNNRGSAGTSTGSNSQPSNESLENRGHLGSSPRFGLGASRSAGGEKGGLNGLRNIGNTCFMNSVIQCLSNTKPLLEYLLNEEYLSDINTTISGMKGALIKAFSNVIQELWAPNAEDKIVNTTNFKSQIQRFAPRFMGYSQQDAQEFLRYLLEGLHEDVNRVTVKPKPITTDIDDTLSDSQKAAEAWKRYLRMDDSKIVDIFVGQLKSTLQCTVCGHCSVTFDPFWDLSLPVPSRTGQLKLTTCLDAFTKEEVLDGDEKPTCSKCKTRRKCTKSFSIQKFPKILVLHLKRFSPTERFRGKLSITVDFPCVGLDLSPYAAAKGQGCTYNLYAISNHSGTTYSGHYTAYCKHPYTGNWHEYNDSRVSGLSSRSVVSGEAYVLFYELTTQTSHL